MLRSARPPGPGFTLDQFIESPVDTDVPTGSEVTDDLTTNNVDDNNAAFSVQASSVFANDYLRSLSERDFRTVPGARSYMIDAAMWDKTTTRAGRRVTVIGGQTDQPVTGPYRSCEKRFVLRRGH